MTTITETIRKLRNTKPSSFLEGQRYIITVAEYNTLLDAAERYENALKKLACLGNGDRYGNSIGNVIAQEALAPQTDTAAPCVNSPAPCRMAEDGATRKYAPGAAVSPCKTCGGDGIMPNGGNEGTTRYFCQDCNVTGKESK